MSTEGSSGGRASGLPRPLMDGMSRSRSTGSEDRLSLGSPSLGGMGNGMAGTPGVGQGPSGPHPSKLGHSRDGSTDQLEGQYPYQQYQQAPPQFQPQHAPPPQQYYSQAPPTYRYPPAPLTSSAGSQGQNQLPPLSLPALHHLQQQQHYAPPQHQHQYAAQLQQQRYPQYLPSQHQLPPQPSRQRQYSSPGVGPPAGYLPSPSAAEQEFYMQQHAQRQMQQEQQYWEQQQRQEQSNGRYPPGSSGQGGSASPHAAMALQQQHQQQQVAQQRHAQQQHLAAQQQRSSQASGGMHALSHQGQQMHQLANPYGGYHPAHAQQHQQQQQQQHAQAQAQHQHALSRQPSLQQQPPSQRAQYHPLASHALQRPPPQMPKPAPKPVAPKAKAKPKAKPKPKGKGRKAKFDDSDDSDEGDESELELDDLDESDEDERTPSPTPSDEDPTGSPPVRRGRARGVVKEKETDNEIFRRGLAEADAREPTPEGSDDLSDVQDSPPLVPSIRGTPGNIPNWSDQEEGLLEGEIPEDKVGLTTSASASKLAGPRASTEGTRVKRSASVGATTDAKRTRFELDGSGQSSILSDAVDVEPPEPPEEDAPADDDDDYQDQLDSPPVPTKKATRRPRASASMKEDSFSNDEDDDGDYSTHGSSPKRSATARAVAAGNAMPGGGRGKDKAKRFVCAHAGCGRAFARNFNLQSHIKSHAGVREFDCPECDKKFSRRHDCTRHCISVHKWNKDGTRPGGSPNYDLHGSANKDWPAQAG